MTGSAGETSSIDDLLARTEERRLLAGTELAPATRRELGQFFTPREVAERIAAQPRLDQTSTLSVLDPGAGAGVLTAALVGRALRERPDLKIMATVVEVDPSLHEPLRATLEDCRVTAAAHNSQFEYEIVSTDFIPWATAFILGSLDGPDEQPNFDVVIQNPPYGKVARGSSVRKHLSLVGVEVPNLYAAFLALSTRLLAPQGQLVAITPRSFCNGAYFRPFRRDLLAKVGLDRVCVFNERGTLFADSAVLQETIVFSATNGRRPDKTAIVTTNGHADQGHERLVSYDELVKPDDPEMFLRIPTDVEDDKSNWLVSKLPATLPDLKLQVSTGRVVDFRATEYLRSQPENGAVPLIYPHHFRSGKVVWPSESTRKPNAIMDAPGSRKLLLPRGTYVLVKRLSAKEEPRRVVACVIGPEDIPTSMIGFENHLNVFHYANEGLDSDLAAGLAAWLNSENLELYFRQFSGHTQVNATDLRNMQYPARENLIALGQALTPEHWSDQDEMDKLVKLHVFGQLDDDPGGHGVTSPAEQTVADARTFLKALQFDAERHNERSALVLLALAQLHPGQPWDEATNPPLRTVEIMDFLRAHHGRDYKPNTRETIRRQTLHQFAAAGLVVQNPDQPDRPINSPKWCYQLTDPAIALIHKYKTKEFASALADYLEKLPGLLQQYTADRELMRIPLTLPGGKTLALSPGGQNPLIRDMIEKFCPAYTPGGEILYIGDAGNKWQHVEREAFTDLGVVFDEHGKMPDLVVFMPNKNWLVLLEAASSHGPVHVQRFSELKTLFAASTAELVFVSCFPSRAEMRKDLAQIAWETEVWCADSPNRIIHFDGKRYLEPENTPSK
ncbi:adenine-specific DNA-methyltransferase [Kibdelosporangium banguiense]|uniref:site-specific DNA-methyltransferase (adenine-specific) n=1 Tax=Kibdelosporangium banguiense TaxID=1365924 RepID=A0ABS4TFP6_9PSEU|nr:BsuBI/PstI family type II restriction endonuclease [Kibdelosporangium banguiense]MBP2322661.1 adenine-specific DNA-methyltransferase [Kibdelosporangium banguiense]